MRLDNADGSDENSSGDKRRVKAGKNEVVISRRIFLANGLAAAGSLFISSSVFAAKSESAKGVDISALQGEIKGQVYSSGASEFKEIAHGGLWNRLVPDRAPQYVVRVVEEDDVVEAIKFAKANKLKVVVRGGGHNWCAPSLRNGGMMIDLTSLNKVISIDVENKKAVLQPILSNREVQKALNAKGLSFPTGHCPPVKISGYLLGGGMSWNQGVWGPGVGSVEAIELVTPDGERITASKDQNQDWFYAARGGGSSFFGVALRYHLKLYPLPKFIAGASWFYPISELKSVAEFLCDTAKKLPPLVELSLFLLEAPPELKDKCKDSNNKVCLVATSIFAETEEEAKAAVKPLEECPVIGKCLQKSGVKQETFESLFDMSGALWPPDLRAKVEAAFSNAKPQDMFMPQVDHFLKAPPLAVFMFALFTGPNVPAPLPDDCAFSMSAHLYGGPWTMWKTAEEDADAIEWHKKCVEIMRPFLSGYYISESDTLSRPDTLKEAFLPRNYKRLGELRKKYDPTGLFFAGTEGVS